jgi:CBS domain-containing protein
MKNDRPKRELQAYEVMTKPVETVRTRDSIHSVATLFSDNNISAAAVMNDQGKPVGVITKTDIVRHEKERNGGGTVSTKQLSRLNDNQMRAGFHLVDDDDTVENWMNPVIFNVKRETALSEVARRMVRYGVHHIFVKGVDEESIVGIVSSFDVLKQVAGGLK